MKLLEPKKIFRITMLILLGLTFISIFNFSNRDRQVLNELSKKVERIIIDVFPYIQKIK